MEAKGLLAKLCQWKHYYTSDEPMSRGKSDSRDSIEMFCCDRLMVNFILVGLSAPCVMAPPNSHSYKLHSFEIDKTTKSEEIYVIPLIHRIYPESFEPQDRFNSHESIDI